MSIDAERLIILGNGFDRAAQLESTFESYIEDKLHRNVTFITDFFNQIDSDSDFDKKMLTQLYDKYKDTQTIRPAATIYSDTSFLNPDFNAYNLSFWDYFLITKKNNDLNWADIEKNMSNFLNDIVPELVDEQTSLKNKFNTGDQSRSILPNNLVTTFKQRLTYLYILDHLLNYNFFDPTISIYSILLIELKKFEDSFKTYLSRISQSEEYRKFSLRQLSKLSPHNEPFSILSFNYTHPWESFSLNNLVSSRNVHGNLESAIIIGIDQNSINNNADLIQFTKTYRIMALAKDRISTPTLPSTIQTLVLFGHSLSEADYSYFQSIFDYYDIYNSDINLVFYYKIYDINKETAIKEEQFQRITKLLTDYGVTLTNKNHGKNLSHRLLLEGRLIIKELV